MACPENPAANKKLHFFILNPASLVKIVDQFKSKKRFIIKLKIFCLSDYFSWSRNVIFLIARGSRDDVEGAAIRLAVVDKQNGRFPSQTNDRNQQMMMGYFIASSFDGEKVSWSLSCITNRMAAQTI